MPHGAFHGDKITEAKLMAIRKEEEQRAVYLGPITIVWSRREDGYMLPGGGRTTSKARAEEVARVMLQCVTGERRAPKAYLPPPPIDELEASPDERILSASKAGGKGSQIGGRKPRPKAEPERPPAPAQGYYGNMFRRVVN